MGNCHCQAVDNASFVLQTQNGRAERFYSPISAAHIMNLHPGHYVALLLTTTFYSSPPSSSSDHHHQHPNPTPTKPLRVTRIKLLRPTDNLLLGHAYRLITTQEVIKGLKAKKNGKSNDNYYKTFQPPEESAGISEANSDTQSAPTTSNHQMRKPDNHRLRTAAPAKSASAASKTRGWHPSLNSISETTN